MILLAFMSRIFYSQKIIKKDNIETMKQILKTIIKDFQPINLRVLLLVFFVSFFAFSTELFAAPKQSARLQPT